MSTGPDSPDGTPAGDESAEVDTLAEVLRRFTFGGGTRTRRHKHLQRSPKHAERTASEQDVGPQRDPGPQRDVGPQRGDGPQRGEWPQQGDARWPTREPPQAESRRTRPVAEEQVDPERAQPEPEQAATYIRPYAWTGGRTRSKHRFELETLISTSELAQTSRLERLEHQSITDLCRHPRSVAEVGAVLGVPLGVARVLLGDLADLGLITVHRTVTENGSTSHLMLMERVLSGLRRL